MSASTARAPHGFSLVELVLAIVVIGISVVSVMAIFIVTTQHSADPMARQQAQLIAEAYLEEILPKRFYDPEDNLVCTGTVESRTSRDNVCDYHMAVAEAPTDQFGTPIAALSAFSVLVTVDSSGVSLNGIDNTTPTSQIRVLFVTVTVTGPNNTSVTLNAFRTNYECNAGPCASL